MRFIIEQATSPPPLHQRYCGQGHHQVIRDLSGPDTIQSPCFDQLFYLRATFTKRTHRMEKKYSNNQHGSLGQSYWRAFLKRNSHRTVSKRGQKYELDQQNWTTYANFVNMYDQCIGKMVSAG